MSNRFSVCMCVCMDTCACVFSINTSVGLMLIDRKDAPWMVGMIELEGSSPLSAVSFPSSLCYAAQSCLLKANITMIITTNIPVNRMAG